MSGDRAKRLRGAESPLSYTSGVLETDMLTPSESTTTYQRLIDLSEGGMGRVELTLRRDGKFQRLYAVKRMHGSLQADEASRAMFVEEGRLAGLINHPNVVGVLDVGNDQDGPFLAMEYVEGITVRDLLIHAGRTGLKLPVQICCRIAAQAALGLAAAHSLTSHEGDALHLVHRDVSPHNILVGFDGVVRVADFGIARATGREHRTSTGVLKGKLGYMAPEVLQFNDPDARTDLFSLGVVLFEMLAGRRLYAGKDDAERARRILHEAPPDIGELRTDVPIELQELLMSLLAKDPEHRPTDAEGVAERLDSCVRRLSEEDGVCSIRDYVLEGFEEERAARSDAVRTALDALGKAPALPAAPTTSTSSSAPRPDRRFAHATLVLAGVLLVVAVAVFMVGRPAETPESVVTEDSGVAAAGNIEVRLQTIPAGARVRGEGIRATETPAVLILPRANDEVEITLELDGYQTRRERIRLSESQALELVLTASPEPEPNDDAPVIVEPTPQRRGHARMRRRTKSPPRGSAEVGLDDVWAH